MSESYITRRGGGGGALSWNIVTSETEPPILTNGIWVEIPNSLSSLDIVFDSSQPLTPTNDTLFFRYYPGYPSSEPIKNQNGIIYDLVACQLYTTTGGWQDVNAYVEIDGEWVQFSSIMYCFYTVDVYNSNGNTMSRIDTTGLTKWTFTAGTSMAIQAATMDWSVQSVYVYAYGNSGGAIYELDIGTGAQKNRFPSDESFIRDLTWTKSMAVSSDHTTLYIAQSNAPTRNTSGPIMYKLNLSTGEFSQIGSTGNYGAIATFYNGLTAAQAPYTNGRAVTVLINNAGGITNTGQTIYSYSSTFSSSKGGYYAGVGRTASTSGSWNCVIVNTNTNARVANGNLTSNWPSGIGFLSSGDMVISFANSGVSFYTVPNISPYKTLLTGQNLQGCAIFPNDQILISTTTQFIIIDPYNDTQTTICTSCGANSILAIEPGSQSTFPELFPDTVQYLYNYGQGADLFDKVGTGGTYTEEATDLWLYSGSNTLTVCGSVTPFDLTNVEAVVVTASEEGNLGNALVGVTQEAPTYDTTYTASSGFTNGYAMIDVSSLSGSYYFKASVDTSSGQGTTLRIYTIRLQS